MRMESLVSDYLAGVEHLRNAIVGMSPEQLRAVPIPGKWSTLQVICHLADFETIYADRIKWVVAEENPLLPSGNPDAFAAALSYETRDVQEEIELINRVRSQLGRILIALPEEVLKRTGTHLEAGPLSVEELLVRVTGHVTHHIQFINEKRSALGLK